MRIDPMCNEHRVRVDVDTIRDEFSQIKIRIEFPEGAPNLEPRDSVRITDPSPIVRLNEAGGADLVQRRWSWPDRGKPVFNFRSDGREFKGGRCLIISSGFYEFTPNPKGKQKHKWLFTL